MPSRFNDPPGNSPAESLLAVLVKHIRQLAFVEAIDQRAGRLGLEVEPHIERAFVLKAQAVRRVVHLLRTEPQVRHHGVNLIQMQIVKHSRKFVEVGVQQRDRCVLQSVAGPIEHACVAIEADDLSLGADAFGKQTRVSAAADRGIHDDLARRRARYVITSAGSTGTCGRFVASRSLMDLDYT